MCGRECVGVCRSIGGVICESSKCVKYFIYISHIFCKTVKQAEGGRVVKKCKF